MFWLADIVKNLKIKVVMKAPWQSVYMYLPKKSHNYFQCAAINLVTYVGAA